MKKYIALIFAASMLLAGCCTTSQVTKWQYKTGEFSETELNQLADQGWSIAFVGTGGGQLNYVLKRPKQ